MWPGHHQPELGFLILNIFQTQAKEISGMKHPVRKQQAQRCKLFLGKLENDISSSGEPNPPEMAATAGAGTQHQYRALCKVDVSLGPPVQLGNLPGCS